MPDIEDRSPSMAVDRPVDQRTDGPQHPLPLPATATKLQRLVVGVDGQAPSRQAVDWARAIAAQQEATVEVCQVLPALGSLAGADGIGWPGLGRAMRSAEGAVADALERLEMVGVETRATVLEGSPPVELAGLADDRDADLLILGSHGHGALHRWIMGSISDDVRHRTQTSVLLTKAPPPPARILVATDGEAPARHAMGHAATLADLFGAELAVVHVLETPVYDLETSIDRIQEAYITGGPLARRARPEVLIEIGDPASRIAAASEAWEADLVVTGTRDLRGLRALIGRSVSDAVAHDAGCSVLVVKDRARA